jgi:hypothetical protein
MNKVNILNEVVGMMVRDGIPQPHSDSAFING